MNLAHISVAACLLFAGGAAAQEQPSSAMPSPDASSAPAPTTNVAPDASSDTSATSSTAAPSAMNSGVNASGVTTRVITNGPVPDTPENRAAFKPLSQAGRNTKPTGN
jgi:hypothetical protein